MEYFTQVTIDNKSKISINADDTILVKDATVKAGTYNVFVNTQSLNYSVSNANGYNEDDAKDNIVSTLESIPATSVGVIGLGRDDDSVQVVNIGRINPTDEVHNIVLVIGNKEIALTDAASLSNYSTLAFYSRNAAMLTPMRGIACDSSFRTHRTCTIPTKSCTHPSMYRQLGKLQMLSNQDGENSCS